MENDTNKSAKTGGETLLNKDTVDQAGFFSSKEVEKNPGVYKNKKGHAAIQPREADEQQPGRKSKTQ